MVGTGTPHTCVSEDVGTVPVFMSGYRMATISVVVSFYHQYLISRGAVGKKISWLVLRARAMFFSY
jgi:hypothetical protein